MDPLNGQFTIVAPNGARGVHTREHGVVQFKSITGESAKELWETGFEFLRLTNQGAKELFANTTASERILLLARCRTPEEVAALESIRPVVGGMKKAAQERREQIAAEAQALNA